LTGWLYDKSIFALIVTVITVQVIAVGVAAASDLLRPTAAAGG
jgi:hypothetical protein